MVENRADPIKALNEARRNRDMIEKRPEPIKSLNDTRQYRTIKLPNELVALLVSDD